MLGADVKPPRPADNLTLALDLSSPFSLDEPPYIAIENSQGSSCSGGTLWTTKDGRGFLFGLFPLDWGVYELRVVDKRETTQGIRNGFKLWRFDVANKKWK